jgi:hypothetical protein
VACTLEADGEVREAIARACVEAGLGLLELREERHGLEALFVELVESRPAHGSPPAGAGTDTGAAP